MRIRRIMMAAAMSASSACFVTAGLTALSDAAMAYASQETSILDITESNIADEMRLLYGLSGPDEVFSMLPSLSNSEDGTFRYYTTIDWEGDLYMYMAIKKSAISIPEGSTIHDLGATFVADTSLNGEPSVTSFQAVSTDSPSEIERQGRDPYSHQCLETDGFYMMKYIVRGAYTYAEGSKHRFDIERFSIGTLFSREFSDQFCWVDSSDRSSRETLHLSDRWLGIKEMKVGIYLKTYLEEDESKALPHLSLYGHYAWHNAANEHHYAFFSLDSLPDGKTYKDIKKVNYSYMLREWEHNTWGYYFTSTHPHPRTYLGGTPGYITTNTVFPTTDAWFMYTGPYGGYASIPSGDFNAHDIIEGDSQRVNRGDPYQDLPTYRNDVSFQDKGSRDISHSLQIGSASPGNLDYDMQDGRYTELFWGWVRIDPEYSYSIQRLVALDDDESMQSLRDDENTEGLAALFDKIKGETPSIGLAFLLNEEPTKRYAKRLVDDPSPNNDNGANLFTLCHDVSYVKIFSVCFDEYGKESYDVHGMAYDSSFSFTSSSGHRVTHVTIGIPGMENFGGCIGGLGISLIAVLAAIVAAIAIGLIIRASVGVSKISSSRAERKLSKARLKEMKEKRKARRR